MVVIVYTLCCLDNLLNRSNVYDLSKDSANLVIYFLVYGEFTIYPKTHKRGWFLAAYLKAA